MNFEKREIVCPTDLFGRKAHQFVNKVVDIKSDLYITKDNRKVRGKSLLGLLSIQVRTGDIITVCCNSENMSLAKMEINHIISILNGLGIDETL